MTFLWIPFGLVTVAGLLFVWAVRQERQRMRRHELARKLKRYQVSGPQQKEAA